MPGLTMRALRHTHDTWQAEDDVNPVRTVNPTSVVRLAAAQASYAVQVPTGLPAGYRPTSARTDAARARKGDPVTLQLGYVTPSEQYAGFVESDDPQFIALVRARRDEAP